MCHNLRFERSYIYQMAHIPAFYRTRPSFRLLEIAWTARMHVSHQKQRQRITGPKRTAATTGGRQFLCMHVYRTCGTQMQQTATTTGNPLPGEGFLRSAVYGHVSTLAGLVGSPNVAVAGRPWPETVQHLQRTSEVAKTEPLIGQYCFAKCFDPVASHFSQAYMVAPV